jgi:hypothetical protein
MLASGSVEEIWLDIKVTHADGTVTDYGTVSRTNFKEQAEALAKANQGGLLKQITKKLFSEGLNSNG